MNIAYYDIETEAIPKLEGQRDIRVIHSIAIAVNDEPAKVYTKEKQSYSDGTFNDAIDILNSCDINIGHNSIPFDKPVIQQVLDVNLTAKQLDTMILSKIVFNTGRLVSIDMSLGWDKDPDLSGLIGSYSLEAFGIRLGNNKIDFHDWSKLTEEMCIYNKQDVEVTRDLYRLLLSNEMYPSDKVIDIEMEAAEIVSTVSINGFYIDRKKALELQARLLYERQTVKAKLLEKYKPMLLPEVVKSPHTKIPSKGRRVKEWYYNPSFKGYWYWDGPSKLHNKIYEG